MKQNGPPIVNRPNTFGVLYMDFVRVSRILLPVLCAVARSEWPPEPGLSSRGHAQLYELAPAAALLLLRVGVVATLPTLCLILTPVVGALHGPPRRSVPC